MYVSYYHCFFFNFAYINYKLCNNLEGANVAVTIFRPFYLMHNSFIQLVKVLLNYLREYSSCPPVKSLSNW